MAAATRGLARWHARVGIVAASVVLLVLGGLTWQRSAIFKDEETLWRETLERNPRAWMADINLGRLYPRSKTVSTRRTRGFRHALEYENPEQDKARHNLGRMLERRPADTRTRSSSTSWRSSATRETSTCTTIYGNLLLGEATRSRG